MSDEELEDMSVKFCIECDDAEKAELRLRAKELETQNTYLCLGLVFFAIISCALGVAIGI